MPISKSSFTRITAILLLVGLAAMIAIIATSFWLVERTQLYFEEVVEARENRAAADDLRNHIQQLEVSHRTYLLTGEESALNTYYEARDGLVPAHERLSELLATFPEASDPLARLRAAIDVKVAATDRGIELRRADNLGAALELFADPAPREAIREGRDFLEAIIATADARLTAGVEDQRAAANALRLATVLGGFVVILVVGASVWTALNFTRDLVAAHEEVEALNAELEARVDERTEELLRANQEIQRFAYIVTHDLRAPLVNIMGFTSELDETMRSIQKYVLDEGGTLEEHEIHDARQAAASELPEAISFIRSSTKKMDALINAILKISRDGRRPLKPESIRLQDMIQASADAIRHQVEETDGEVDIAIDLPPIVSDRLSLEQIFGNLLDNANKYRAKDRPLKVTVSGRQLPGRRVAVEVADNGRGIAPQDRARVFDLFRRSGPQDQPGEGIGLAHVRTLVRNLGGDITLASEEGQGATFTVILAEDVRNVIRSTTS